MRLNPWHSVGALAALSVAFGADAHAWPQLGASPPSADAVARNAARLSTVLDVMGPFDPAVLDARAELAALRTRLNALALADDRDAARADFIGLFDLEPTPALIIAEVAPSQTFGELAESAAPESPARLALDFGRFEDAETARLIGAEAASAAPAAMEGLSLRVAPLSGGGVALRATGALAADTADARCAMLRSMGLACRVVRLAAPAPKPVHATEHGSGG